MRLIGVILFHYVRLTIITVIESNKSDNYYSGYTCNNNNNNNGNSDINNNKKKNKTIIIIVIKIMTPIVIKMKITLAIILII